MCGRTLEIFRGIGTRTAIIIRIFIGGGITGILGTIDGIRHAAADFYKNGKVSAVLRQICPSVGRGQAERGCRGMCFLLVGGAAAAGANSYIEMITTPPPDQLEQRAAVAVATEKAGVWPQQTAERPNIGSTYLPTVSPVVVPPYHKYAAWQKAQANGGYYPYQDNVQNLIYFLGGVVAGRVAYDIWGPYHRHHLLDHW